MPPKLENSESEVDLQLIPSSSIPANMMHPVYKKLLPQAPDGIAFLFSTRFSDALNNAATHPYIAHIYKVTAAQAIEELRRLLAIKTFLKDHDADKVSPSPLMDHMWHACILDTRLYADVQRALNCMLHHHPSGTSDVEEESWNVRLRTMEALYGAYFSSNPLGSTAAQSANLPSQPAANASTSLNKRLYNEIEVFVPPSSIRCKIRRQSALITIKVLPQTGNIVEVKVSKEALIWDIKELVQGKAGIPANQQGHIFMGQQLQDGKTLAECGITDGDIINLIPRMVGC